MEKQRSILTLLPLLLKDLQLDYLHAIYETMRFIYRERNIQSIIFRKNKNKNKKKKKAIEKEYKRPGRRGFSGIFFSTDCCRGWCESMDNSSWSANLPSSCGSMAISWPSPWISVGDFGLEPGMG
ncbi:hypothetical protein MANES_06G046875v8 [Manihot esculenta]|uniref:Uncharacterized protein n=1 Tax=Manihot esculenta TaxID=3983 RepID=A0ACB7HJ75_MANES|nr:hypothetical protein MANES_06G046875v8 [Manihot esculenta]